MHNNTCTCAATADLERRLSASQAELAAARAQVASLLRQLTLRVEAMSLTVVCGDDEPTRRHGPTATDRFDEPTRRREPVTKVLNVPYVEVRS